MIPVALTCPGLRLAPSTNCVGRVVATRSALAEQCGHKNKDPEDKDEQKAGLCDKNPPTLYDS
jgi:hypothetical protein